MGARAAVLGILVLALAIVGIWCWFGGESSRNPSVGAVRNALPSSNAAVDADTPSSKAEASPAPGAERSADAPPVQIGLAQREAGRFENLEQAREIFKKLRVEIYPEIESDLLAFAESLEAYIAADHTPAEKTLAKYLLAQTRRELGNLDASEAALADVLNSSDYVMLNPSDRAGFFAFVLALDHAHREFLGTPSEQLARLSGVNWENEVPALGDAKILGYQAGDLLQAFQAVDGGQASALDRFRVESYYFAEVLQSVDHMHLVLGGSEQEDVDGLIARESIPLVESEAFANELAALYQTDREQALIIEYFRVYMYADQRENQTALQLAAGVCSQTNRQNNPYYSDFANLAARSANRLNDRATFVRYLGQVQRDDFVLTPDSLFDSVEMRQQGAGLRKNAQAG